MSLGRLCFFGAFSHTFIRQVGNSITVIEKVKMTINYSGGTNVSLKKGPNKAGGLGLH